MIFNPNLCLPLIPEHWLHRIFAHAKKCGGDRPISWPTEQIYYFHWLDGQWLVQVPRQKIDAPSIVLELCSHHCMPASFDCLGNHDQQGCRFYAVIGRLYEHHPEIRLRLGLYGDFMEISPIMLFGGWGPFMEAT